MFILILLYKVPHGLSLYILMQHPGNRLFAVKHQKRAVLLDVYKRQPCALLVLGAACTGYGILRGEPAIVLQKAVSICMECIGIG